MPRTRRFAAAGHRTEREQHALDVPAAHRPWNAGEAPANGTMTMPAPVSELSVRTQKSPPSRCRRCRCAAPRFFFGLYGSLRRRYGASPRT